MSRNPTAAVNLFLVGKQYLTFCTAEDAVTRNLIGRKIISNVKPSDIRNSLGTVAFVRDVIPSSHKRQTRVCTAAERYVKHRCPLYVLGAPSHFPTEYRLDSKRQWSVGNTGWREWCNWGMVINDHCHGSVHVDLVKGYTSILLGSKSFNGLMKTVWQKNCIFTVLGM